MEPISNADRIILLLRQKLLERSRAAGVGRSPTRPRPAGSPLAEPAGVAALAALDGADEHMVRRALIHNLLAEHFGSDLINDAQFQMIVSRVTEAIEEDPEACQLLSQVLAELRRD